MKTDDTFPILALRSRLHSVVAGLTLLTANMGGFTQVEAALKDLIPKISPDKVVPVQPVISPSPIVFPHPINPDILDKIKDAELATPPEVVGLTDAVIPGSLGMTILPPEAVTDGAAWSIDNGAELTSGSLQQGITPGRHVVTFRNLPAWREPAALDVLVIGGRPVQQTATYTRLPSFAFQDVPPQQARHGETLEFFVTSGDPNNALEVQAQPAPAGSIAFDAGTGHFQFTPAVADRLPFALTFTGTGGQSATTTITPLPVLPAEEITINYERVLPNAESRDYITVSETKNAPEIFNDFEQETLSIGVSGATLVFASDHPGLLYQQFNGRENIKHFRLYADRVVIRSPLVLRQTHVTIHARELRFEGNGSIETTPRARVKVPAGVVFEDRRTVGIDGDPGHKGGDVDVFVERFHSDPFSGKRFVLRGGSGGPAGDGRDGRSELSFPFPSAEFNDLMARSGNSFCGTHQGKILIYTEDRFGTEPADTCGKKVAARGENAVPSGRPGLGGAGGTLRSTVNLNGHADLAGGVSGAKAGNHVGASLTRVYGYLFTRTHLKSTGPITTTSFQAAQKVRGNDAPAPAALSPAGAPGQIQPVSDPAVWVHSFSVRPIIQMAKDIYLNGHELDARAILSEYTGVIGALLPAMQPDVELSDEVFAEQTNLRQSLLEMETMIHRIDSNLDFFGNPAGWVPMLSFEANLGAFENEVNQSIPILYLAHWLSRAAASLEDSLSASEAAHDQLENELGDMISTFNQAQSVIPRLKLESETIKLRIAGLQGRLLSLEAQLKQRAEQNVEDKHKLPFWKKALGTLSVISHLVPVGQPVVGQIGSGLGLISQFDPENPLQSATNIVPKAFDIFSQKDISVCFSGTVTNKGTNAPNPKQERAKRLSECGKFLNDELKQLGKVFKEAQASKDEISAELAKLKASDPVFKQVTAELEELNADKERFGQELAAALQAVTSLTSAMLENVLTTHELEDRISTAATALDHNALLHIKELEARAKDRLLKFQYFTAKAFQYRTLQPYSGNLQLNRLFERFKTLIEAGNSHVLSSDDFNILKSLYVAELRDIVSQAFTILNSNAPERSLPISFRLNAQELQQLNGQGQLTINLQKRGLFPAGRQNIRIADLRTRQLNVHLEGGSAGAHALLFVDFEHLGVSRLTSGGQTFLFRHNQTEAVNPISWGTVFDGVANQFNNSQLSPASQSLIRTLLNQPSNSDLLLFSSPAAAAEIQLVKQVLTDNGVNMVIDELQVEVVFESAQSSATVPELDVVVTDDLEPVITLSRADLNGRQDGQGDFRRMFPANTPVTLEAPLHFGEMTFERWVVNGQLRTAGSPTVSLTMPFNTRAEARYVLNTTVVNATANSSQPQAVAGPSTAKPQPLGARFNRTGNDNHRAATVALSPAAAPKGFVSFTFPSVAGVRYVIENTPALGQEWTRLEAVTGTGNVMQYIDSAHQATGFYRVRVEGSDNSL